MNRTNTTEDSRTIGSITERIKQFALEAGGDVVGIADPNAWDEHVPEGHRPYDILPGAKSVIVVGVRGPTAGAWRSASRHASTSAMMRFRSRIGIRLERRCISA